MRESEKLVPRRRFNEFINGGVWEQRKLGDVVTIKSGMSPSAFGTGSELYVKVDDLNYSFREQNDTQIKVSPNSKSSKVKKGSIIFPKRGAAIMTNKVRIMGVSGYMDTNMMALEPENICSAYLYLFINKIGLYKIADTSTIPQINNKHIEPYQIPVPSKAEQIVIGEYFQNLDALITLHQHKVEKIKALKSAYLSEMFPAEGECKPKRRFAGFTEEWEQRKVKEAAPLQRGFDLPKNQMQEGDYPVVMSNGINGYHYNYKVKGPGVVTGRSGTIGNLHYIESNYWPHNTALWVTDFKCNFPKFIYYLYQHLDLRRFGTGSGVPTLNRNDIHSEKVYIPEYKEQVEIVAFLEQFDNLITLHQQKLEKLQNIKKAFLNEMFI